VCSFVVSCARGRLRRFGATFRGKKKAFAREYAEKITAEFKAALDDRQSSGATSANGTGSGGGDDDSEAEAALDDALDAMLDAQAGADGNLFDDFDDYADESQSDS
jgi:hypothetical protein